MVTGASGNDWTEIKSGLARGDTIVTKPDDRLTPGRDVTVQSARKG